jgi:Mg2+/Co2+ transporter CorB
VDISLSFLVGIFLLSLVGSAFFSASETGMMATNRYRLRHLANQGHAGAKRVLRLLEHPDRMIGVILLGNNFVNTLASSVATVIAIQLGGETAVAIAALTTTILLLIFGEVTPKMVAALLPERIAFPVSRLILPLLTLLYPLVWIINLIGVGLLKLFGVSLPQNNHTNHQLNMDELRTLVHEAEGIIQLNHREMLLGILDLEKKTVEDIMIPRSDILGIDLEDSLATITLQLSNAQHSRLLLYQDSIENVIGIIHLRKLLSYFQHNDLDKETLKQEAAKELYFIPEGTSLYTQLLNFQRQKRRIGLVVNEYGDIQGLVTLEDILEEIVGEFTTSPDAFNQHLHPQTDGTYLVDASMTIRDLNKALHWQLSTDGARTLNGLILNYLETIPQTGTSFRISNYPMEIIHVTNNAIKTVRIFPDKS